MKIKHFVFIVFFLPKIGLSQVSKTDTFYYSRTHFCLEAINEHFIEDSIVKVTKYHFPYIKDSDNKMTLSVSKKNKKFSVRYYYIDGSHWKNCGRLAEYWYINEKKSLEIFTYENGYEKYVNQWDKNSKQILKNGNGIYHSNSLMTDSIITEVRDSLLDGESLNYTKNSNGDFYLFSKEKYERNRPIGIKTTFFENGNTKQTEELIANSDSILFISFYESGSIKEKGRLILHLKFGRWNHYSEEGKLIKEIDYLNGEMNGIYREFYSNGKVKIEGKYGIGEKEFEVSVMDPITYKETIEYRKGNGSIKTGIWLFKNEDGRIIKSENHELRKE